MTDLETIYARLKSGAGRELIRADNVAALRERAQRDGDEALVTELQGWRKTEPANESVAESIGRAITSPVREAAEEEDPALRSARR